MKRIQLLILLICCLHVSSYGQSGSYIYSKYTSNGFWNETLFPSPPNGKAYLYPKVDTVSSEWTSLILSIFKFSPAHYFPHVIDSIQTTRAFIPEDSLNNTFNSYFLADPGQAFKQLNPIRSYSFTLQNITDTAFTTFTPKYGPVSAADTEICFFIIPGSGDNQTSAIVRGLGYHTLNCNVVSTLSKHGDVYVYIKPNEDVRAIRIKQLPAKKMLTDNYPTDSYLNQYLISNYRHEGINYLIECVAAIKQLKQKYKKVFVLGCSQGGYASLYSALETEVDGVLISSGYSIKLDDNYLIYGNMAQKFAQLPFLLQKDSVKTKISQQKTSYYFSWPPNDSQIYSDENTHHYTQNYFAQGVPLNNTKFLYSYLDHSFPPCIYIDSFVKEVKYKPKAFVTDTLNVCVYDSLVRRVEFIGQGPFTYDVYRNDTLFLSDSTMLNADTLVLYDEGNYQIKNIVGANASNGIWSDHFFYSKAPRAALHITSKVFQCDSAFTKVGITFQGKPPYHLTTFRYTSTGSILFDSELWSQLASVQLNLPNGDYLFTMSDSNACEVLSDSIHLQDSAAHYQWVSEQYNCIEKKSEMQFELEGRAPYLIHYYKDGIAQNSVEQNQHVDWMLTNGSYFISEIIDSNNCVFAVNQQFNIQYDSLEVNAASPVYQCESNMSAIEYELSGNAPFSFNYEFDGTPLSIQLADDSTISYGNGALQQISVTDATGCVYPFTSPTYTFANNLFSSSFLPPVYSCDSSKYKIHFDLQGDAPFTIFYQKDFQNEQYVSNQPSFDLYLENGHYLIQKIMDSKGCEADTNQMYNLFTQALAASITQTHFVCDSVRYQIELQLQGVSPWQLEYSDGLNQLTHISNSNTTSLMLNNGDWTLNQVTDAAGCLFQFPSNLYHVSYDTMQAQLSGPLYDCDSAKMSMHLNVSGNPPYTLFYQQNGINQQFVTYQNTQDIFFDNGTYFFQKISDSTGCEIDTTLMYNFSYQAFNASISSHHYNCDSNKYEINFSLTGNSPWQIHYTDGFTNYTYTTTSSSPRLMLGNGVWTINTVNDLTACSQVINETFELNYTALSGSIISQNYDCDSSGLNVLFQLTGNAPWVIHYMKNALNPLFYDDTSSNANPSVYLPFGTYTFLNITDSTGCNLPLVQTAINNLLPLSAHIISNSFNCDSNKTQITYLCDGVGPWTITYTDLNTGLSAFFSSNTPNLSLYLNNGDYAINSIQDMICQKVLNDTIHLNHIPFTSYITPKEMVCDSNKYMIRIVSHGGIKPYHYNYYYNGNVVQLNSLNDTTTLMMKNGNYLFASATDSIGCEVVYNNLVVADYSDFQFNQVSQNYVCDKDSTQVTFDITRDKPVWLVYTKDLFTTDTLLMASVHQFNFSNGNYKLVKLYDSFACERNINQQIIIQHEPVSYSSLDISKDCEHREFVYTFQLNGQAPWNLYYNINNIFDTLQIPDTTFQWHTPDGIYYLINLTDANGCDVFIGESDTLNSFLPEHPVLKLTGDQLITQEGASHYYWYKNSTLIDSVSGHNLIYNGKGEYYAVLIDSEGCSYITNHLNVNFTHGITAYPNPGRTFTRIVITEPYGNYWDYELVDMMGNKVMAGNESSSFKEFDLSHLNSGIYNLIIVYEEDFSKHIIRITKQ